MKTTQTKLWQTFVLSVSICAVLSTSAVAMNEEHLKIHPHYSEQMNAALHKINKGEQLNDEDNQALMIMEQAENPGDPNIPITEKDEGGNPINPFTFMPKEVLQNIGNRLDGKNLAKLRLQVQDKKMSDVFARPHLKEVVHKKFHGLLISSTSLYQNEPLLSEIDSAFEKDRADILKGCLLWEGGKLEDALNMFKGKNLPLALQNTLNDAAYYGKFGFDEVTGRKYLETRAKQDDTNAQERLNDAAYYGKFGFDEVTGRKYLETRAKEDDTNAQERLNDAAYYGNFGFDEETGRKYLETRAGKGDTNAQERLNDASYLNKLGFDEVTGKEYLETRAKERDADAQRLLNMAGRYGNLGFAQKTGREYLKKRAKKGDTNAQKRLNDAAYYGKLGFDEETGQEYLETRAEKGDTDAQEQLHKTFFFSFYNLLMGFEKFPAQPKKTVIENNVGN